MHTRWSVHQVHSGVDPDGTLPRIARASDDADRALLGAHQAPTAALPLALGSGLMCSAGTSKTRLATQVALELNESRRVRAGSPTGHPTASIDL
ncbi:MAG: hypothetical protein QOG75_1231 [Mycobacterium sp.]|nr:hypothetical protein [Mycobacterium sp.]